MKSRTISTLFLWLLLASSMLGQNSVISFSFTGMADGQYVPLGRIDVRNLNRNCDTTLLWPDTVLTIYNVGMDDLPTSGKVLQVFQNTPNPAEGSTSVRIYTPETGPVQLQIADFSGRTIINLNKELKKGYHTFLFTPDSKQLYFLTAMNQSSRSTIKIAVNKTPGPGACSLSYLGTEGNDINYKSAGASGQFLFALGDNLELKGYSNGLTAMISDAPTTGKAYTFILTAFTCGSSIIINHLAGAVAPVTKTVSYGTVTDIPGEPLKCWITSNLGADHQASSVDDATEPPAGWYWQFNRKQGYKYDGTTRTPNTTWIYPIVENLYWQTSNDPCALELGNGWRIPSYSEWFNVDAAGDWTDWNGPWNSGLKLHAAGTLGKSNGSLYSRGSYGFYWSGTQKSDEFGWFLYLYTGRSFIDMNYKAYGFSLRCIRE